MTDDHTIGDMGDEPVIMLDTPHGSHLYGLATPASDEDRFIVLANAKHRRRARYALQKIDREEGSDDLLTDVSTFAQYAKKGVPQYLEAMWSTKATVDLLGGMRFAFRPDVYATEDTYIRTARNFWEKGEAYQERAMAPGSPQDPGIGSGAEVTTLINRAIKLKRHAYRLCLNLQTMRLFGRFDPTLSEDQQRQLRRMLHADETTDKYLGVTS